MQTLIDIGYFLVQYDKERDVVLIRRQARPFKTPDDLPQLFEALINAAKSYTGKPALVDLRLAKGNNSPLYEATIKSQVRRLGVLFPRSAVLVQSAAGRLQVQRLARERGDSGQNVFTDEAEAFAFLDANR
jgi:hypothetical protein